MGRRMEGISPLLNLGRGRGARVSESSEMRPAESTTLSKIEADSQSQDRVGLSGHNKRFMSPARQITSDGVSISLPLSNPSRDSDAQNESHLSKQSSFKRRTGQEPGWFDGFTTSDGELTDGESEFGNHGNEGKRSGTTKKTPALMTVEYEDSDDLSSSDNDMQINVNKNKVTAKRTNKTGSRR